jgi:hypothetical protein
MPLTRFTSDSHLVPSEDLNILFYNYGLSVFVAQQFESSLGILIVASEALGMLKVDRQALGIDSVLDRCVGPNLKVLEESGLMNKAMQRDLKKANMQRNLLIHRFFLENFVDLTSPLGRTAVNDLLQRIYLHIKTAVEVLSALNNTLLTKLGYDEKWAISQFRDLKEAVSDHDIAFVDNPYVSRIRITEHPSEPSE